MMNFNLLGRIAAAVTFALGLCVQGGAETIDVIPDTNIQSIFTLQSPTGPVTVDKTALTNNTAFFFSGDESPKATEYPLSDLSLITPCIYKEDSNLRGAPNSGYDLEFIRDATNTFYSGVALTYIGTGFSLAPTVPLYFIVKDGAAGHYVFNITGWQGHTIRFENLYPVGTDLNVINSNGEVSNAALFSSSKGGTNVSVPDSGATALLLGLALVAVGFTARRFAVVNA